MLWVGSPWDPKYMLLLTFTTLNVLSIRELKCRLHKSRYFKNIQQCWGNRRVPGGRSTMSPSMDLPRYSAYVPPTNYRRREIDFFGWDFLIFYYIFDISEKNVTEGSSFREDVRTFLWLIHFFDFVGFVEFFWNSRIPR